MLTFPLGLFFQTSFSSSVLVGPPRMSPKSQRMPRAHRVPPSRTTGMPPPVVDLISHTTPGDVPVTPSNRGNSSGGTWSSVVSGGTTFCVTNRHDARRLTVLACRIVHIFLPQKISSPHQLTDLAPRVRTIWAEPPLPPPLCLRQEQLPQSLLPLRRLLPPRPLRAPPQTW